MEIFRGNSTGGGLVFTIKVGRRLQLKIQGKNQGLGKTTNALCRKKPGMSNRLWNGTVC